MNNQSYLDNLIKTVIEASEANNWNDAVQEWEIIDCEEDESCSSECVCKHLGLRYLYTIRNVMNGNELAPIGSTCIKKFEREDLNEEISVMEQMFSLLHAVERHERIELNTKYFSKKLLEKLFKENVFNPNQYNHYNGQNDYEFLLKMFRKKDKSSISDAQRKKITAIIMNSILPYLKRKLRYRRTI